MKIKFEYEKIDDYFYRIKVYRGWLVGFYNEIFFEQSCTDSSSIIYIIDPNHEWEIEK